MRTVLVGGIDETWEDFILNKSYTHIWMNFVPVLLQELDFLEILGLNVLSPALVLNNAQDPLFTLAGIKK
jgi:hypothetical protein